MNIVVFRNGLESHAMIFAQYNLQGQAFAVSKQHHSGKRYARVCGIC